MAKYPGRPYRGHFWIQSDAKDDNLLEGYLGRQFPVTTDGYAGWGEQQRVRRRTALRWDGSPVVRVRFDVLLTNLSPRHRQTDKQNAAIRTLEKMAGLTVDGDEPPNIRWAANHQHDYINDSHTVWVIETLEWSDDSADWDWDSDGDPIKAYAMLTISTRPPTEFIKTSVAKRNRQSAKKGNGGSGGKHKTYTVKAGDTLSKIAARELGSASRYPEIAKLNGIRDPHDIHTGQVLKIP